MLGLHSITVCFVVAELRFLKQVMPRILILEAWKQSCLQWARIITMVLPDLAHFWGNWQLN